MSPLVRSLGALAFAQALCVSFVGVAAAQSADGAAGDASDASATRSEPAREESDVERRLRALEGELRASRATRPAPVSPAALAATSQERSNARDFAPAVTPFAFDQSWAPGAYAPATPSLSAGPFTGEIRLDAPFHYSFANPADNTISGSSEVFRHGELQVTQIGAGGDFYFKGVHARLMTQFGMYSQTTPRNDASASRGQWSLDDAYRYISEAYAGYHVDALAGINIQAGIFMSYVGLWSYYNFDNWTYQPSYVSSNTPWFFNGVRVQVFVNDRLKIEPWIVNGWQAYGRFNNAPGVGLQVRWAPTDSLIVLGNQYVGADTLGVPGRIRVHTDDSVMARFYNKPEGALSRIAASLTVDAGCEFGDGTASAPAVSCGEQFFLGFMAYVRVNFYRNMFGLTVGGGAITNPGRYLVLVPPINGATAFSGTPYFTANKGDRFEAWDVQSAVDFMPTRNITFRLEFVHRAANVPYFAGPGGVTPPGGNQGTPGSMLTGWAPDLVPVEDRITAALLVRL